MPARRVPMRRIKEVLRLKLDCGLSHRQIVAALGVSLGAVSKFVSLAEREGLSWAAMAGLDEDQIEARLCPKAAPAKRQRAPPDCGLIHRELRRKGVTLQLLWEEYVEAHGAQATYRYTQFCQHYRNHVGQLKRSMRQEHRAGEKLFADFAGQTLTILDPAGGPSAAAHIFVAVLGASNYTYDCAAHYGTVILPARPRRPQDKAKVEVGVQIVERWILARLRHRRLFSLHEANVAVAELLEDLNHRPFKKLPGNRREWFDRLDRPVLKPLPALPYRVAFFKRCRINIDYHVDVDGHYYSVPHALGRQEVDVRLCGHTVEILYHGKRVASHAKSTRRGYHTTVAEHMPAAHRAHMEWTPGRFLNWAATIGVAVTGTQQLELTLPAHANVRGPDYYH